MFHAIAQEGRISLASLQDVDAVRILQRSTQRVSVAVGQQRAWMFAWGALVYEADERDPALERTLSQWLRLPSLEATYEDLAVHIHDAAPRVDWRAVWLPSIGEEVEDVIVLLLGRSVGLDRYEQLARPLLIEGADTLRTFADGGRTPWAISTLVRRLARSSVSRIELAQWFVHLDRPESTWTDPVADKLYALLSDDLELRERQQLLNHQMGALEDGLSRVFGVWEGRHARGLEWAILLLILVEVVMALLEL